MPLTKTMAVNSTKLEASNVTIATATSISSSTLDQDVTIIVTTNLIPSSPAIDILNQTLWSMDQYIEGIQLQRTPLIVCVDGLDDHFVSRDENATVRWQQYVSNIQTNFSWATVIAVPRRRWLVRNLQDAIARATTEFIYVIQHDMPFQKHVDHRAIIQSMRQHPPYQRPHNGGSSTTSGIYNLSSNDNDNYDDPHSTIKVVRFNYIRRHADKFNNCGDDKTTILEENGIILHKHHVWSDNNHLTRKSYYEELWDCCFPKVTDDDDGNNNDAKLFMEHEMRSRAWNNCSYWGTHLYGYRNYNTIGHLDGRQSSWGNCKTQSDYENGNCG